MRPQDDLYRFVNGTWLKNTAIPADKSNYGSFTKLADDAEKQLQAIIEEAAARTDKKAGSDEQKVGDYYAAFMDEARADELGLKPLEGELARIDALKDRKELAALFAQLSRIGVYLMPGYIDTDAKDSTQYMVYLFQGGIGLPDRDFYLDKSEKFAQIRARYEAHIGNMLKLAGIEQPEAQAKAIMALETKLAEKQWDKVDSRDADKTYNPWSVADLEYYMGYVDKMAQQTIGDLRAYATKYIVGKPRITGVLIDPAARQSLSLTKAELMKGGAD